LADAFLLTKAEKRRNLPAQMKWFFSRNTLWLCAAAAVLMVAIRLFEAAFTTGQLSAKIYITLIGIIFLAVGAFSAAQLVRRKTIVQYIEKQPETQVRPNDLLTHRETEILSGIAQGLSNKEIGEQLFVSENTVKKHVANIYFKLEVSRRTQAVAKAKSLKILAG
jgi:DNA-binding CsgD family transcriptional regulator